MIVLLAWLLVLTGVACLSSAVAMSKALAAATGPPKRLRTLPMTRCRRIAGAAFVLATVVSVALAVVPLGSSTTTSIAPGPNGQVISETQHKSLSLVEAEGSSVLIVLLVPVLITGLGAFARGRWEAPVRRSMGALAVACSLIAMMSIGIFYLPSAILLAVAGTCTPRYRRYGRIADRDRAAFAA